jgi:RNA polymerase sigma-70 factor (ECF subfamily)
LALSQADFQRWVVEHGPPMYRIAYRMVGDRHEAEDVVQDAFRSAWKSRRSFEAGRGERAWLVAILRRRVVDHWRRGPALNVVSSENSLEIGVNADDPLANDYSDEMQSALACLPPELKETLLLVVVAELTHQEAADLLKVPLGTVLSRVSRARARLREALLGRGAAKLDARVSTTSEPTGPDGVAESPRR